MNPLRKCALVLAAISLAACSKEDPDPGPASGVLRAPIELTRSAWIWNRSEPLTQTEAEHLRAAGITRLYWHSAEIVRVSNVWQFPQENPVFAPPVPEGFERIPVLRLAATADTASTRGSFPALGEFIAAYLQRDPATALQIDYDCPEDLLARYAELLGYIRSIAKPERLSVTALAGWAGKPGFDALQQQADEIAVLLYDLRPDFPADIAAGKAIPIVDLETIRATLPRWRQHCRTPWLAGLPNFSRLSVFDNAGLLNCHLHDWNRDALVFFHPDLEITDASADDGLTWLAAKVPALLAGGHSIAPSQRLLLRQPVSESLRESARLAAESGATGITWFPLPVPDVGTGFTPSHLTALLDNNPTPGAPNLSVTHSTSTGILTLANNGPYDLPTRVMGLDGPADRGWQFEIDGGREAAFTEAGPGTFVRMLGHTAADSPKPVNASAQTAQHLTFWFTGLPAGTRIDSAPIRTDAKLRWRLDRGDWQAIPAVP